MLVIAAGTNFGSTRASQWAVFAPHLPYTDLRFDYRSVEYAELHLFYM